MHPRTLVPDLHQVALSADEVAELNTTAVRLGVHGNRYNDRHPNLVGR